MKKYSLKISVIIPTFNREKQVVKAIDSILKQSTPVFEIIVVDDGSTDDTKETLIAMGSRIKYLHQKNSGVAAARNLGISASKGDWIAFLDSDDTWKTDKIEKQLKILSMYNSEVCCSGYEDDTGKACTNLTPDLPPGECRHYTDSLDLVFKYNEHPYVQTMLIKKSLIIKLGLFDETLRTAEDTKLLYRIAFETGISYINEPLFTLNRKRINVGLTDDRSISSALSIYDCSCRVQNEAYWMLISRNSELAKIVRKNMGYFMSRIAEIHLILGNKKLSKRYAKEGLKYASEMKTKIRCLCLYLSPWLLIKSLEKKWNTN